MTLKRVVVTGIGALTPIGNNVAEYWSNLLKGKSGAGHITYFNAEKFKTRFACELKGYNPLEHFTAKELTKLDRCAQYALVTTEEAIRDANVDLEQLNNLFKTLTDMFYVLGLDITYVKFDDNISTLYKEYLQSKEQKDFAKSDEIRKLLIEKGVM